ncbi:hypothetical protein [Paenibacillus sp. UMB4589-SE434]|uniref:hypothetical protein n=1 Tax=Paenibacillus sp. UMB4589-SE434 TaxID=3046314 RepID=UPI00254FA4B6|nr:hypothetical protein [Paenibacillus sp. UMB4589-SE434]MDK8180129.1 hypothetical protein [Paenibacillus sp. UMB4589-SE434]
MSSCSSKNDTIPTKVDSSNISQSQLDKNDADLVPKLERNNKNQVSYLFFNEADVTKTIFLSFYANYDRRTIAKVELLQDNKTVVSNVKLHDKKITNNGKFTISLSKYIPQFNKIKFFDENDALIFTLQTGQYFLEKININNKNNEDSWFLDSYYTLEDAGRFKINAKIKKKGQNKYSYKILLPKKIKDQNILKQEDKSSIKDNNFSFNYESQIDLKQFGNYESISYDMSVIQSDIYGGQSLIMSVNIPLSKTNIINN